jgi:asparagine synthetase B (glutamine-hydrolysing)
MPGLVGIISHNSLHLDQHRNDVATMRDILRHFDDYVVNQYAGLGSRALFADISLNIPGFPAQHYAMPERGIFVALNGEILNIDEIRIAHSLTDDASTNNGAQLVGRLYEHYGDTAFLSYLNGWFSLVLVDEVNGICSVANDRWGFKPFYYMDDGERLVFAPEVKAITAVLGRRRQLDPDAVREYFGFRALLNEKTLFRNVYRLPPASCWTFHAADGRWEKTTYWDVGTLANQPKIAPADVPEAANEVFTNLIGRYLRDPFVFSFTGGWDTRTIASLWDKRDRPQTCITYGPMPNTADWILSRRITERYGIPHKFYQLDDAFLDDFVQYAERVVFLADGMGDIACSELAYLNPRFRNSILLTGKYGSQVFGVTGMPSFLSRPDRVTHNLLSDDFCCIDDTYLRDTARSIAKRFGTYAEPSERHLIITLVEECRRYWGDTLAVESTTNLVRSPYVDNDWIELLMSIPTDMRSSRLIQGHIIRANSPELARIPTNSGGLPQRGDLWGEIEALFFKLRYWMSVAANSRRIPPWLSLDRTFLARNATKNLGHWLRCGLKDDVEDLLLGSRTRSRGIYRLDKIEKAIHDHMGRRADYRGSILKLVSFELFLRKFVDHDSTP